MGRRRYHRRKNNLASVVVDVADIASKMSWWGAFLTGLLAYLLITHGLGTFIQARIDNLAGNPYAFAAFRLEYVVYACVWVGRSCLLVGVWFAIRNYFNSRKANRKEKSLISILAKLVSRIFD